MTRTFDLAVVGGGSGGIGAALAGARLGLSTVLIEQAESLGGNAVRGGVHDWEPSVGGTGIPFDIYCRLHERSDEAVGIASFYEGYHKLFGDDHPGGEKGIDPTRTYLNTLRHHRSDKPVESWSESKAFIREHRDCVVFEPADYVTVVNSLLEETGHCTILTGHEVTDVMAETGTVQELVLGSDERIKATYYIDSTASGQVCQACGCEVMVGQESSERFDESHAPTEPTDRLNAVTLIYRISKSPVETTVEPPFDIPTDAWWAETFPGTRLTEYPNGDLNVNMLPTMEGDEFMELIESEGYDATYQEARRRVFAHWQYLNRDYERFRSYELTWVAPELGIRESYRIKGEYILTEHDILGGLSEQPHDDIITIADHPLDWHSKDDGGSIHLTEPYGVPYRCLIPEGFQNLLIACRGASFSSIAASSCRLSRSMLQLGQAAGTAAALADADGHWLPEVPSTDLRHALREQHVELDWPRSEAMTTYLRSRDPASS